MEHVKQKSWFQRNWVWALPAGVFGGVAIVGIFVTVIVSFVFGTIKKSDVFQEALWIARESDEVVGLIGEPIEPGFSVAGDLHIENAEGDANLKTTLKGPRGEGTLSFVAIRHSNTWRFTKLSFADDLGHRIDLTPAPAIPADSLEQ